MTAQTQDPTARAAGVDDELTRVARRTCEHTASVPLCDTLLANIALSLRETSSPKRARLGMIRLLERASAAPTIVRGLAATPRLSRTLATLFAGSPFLTDVILQNPSFTEILAQPDTVSARHGASYYASSVSRAMTPFSRHEDRLEAIRAVQRLQVLRIGSADLLGLWDLAAVTEELSDLAEGLVQGALGLAAQRIGIPDSSLCVLALGKLGGRELNYSSDVDLVFLSKEPNREAQRLAAALIDALSRTTSRGFAYRVDARLRPWGHSGPLVRSPESYLDYVDRHARLWERQALLKARDIAGNRRIGEAFLRSVHPLLMAMPQDRLQKDIREMKRRVEQSLEASGSEWGEVKHGVGSLRDIEFVAQYLQLVHASDHPEILTGNTIEALARLRHAGLLTAPEHQVLSSAYRFLRPIEHMAQLVHNRQTHSLPTDETNLDLLAQRIGFEGAHPGQQLVRRYEEQRRAVRTVFERHLDPAGKPQGPTTSAARGLAGVRRHAHRMPASYERTFAPDVIARHANLAARLDPQSNLADVFAEPLGKDRWRVEIVAFDEPGAFGAICGLLYAFGCNIQEGYAYGYRPRDLRGAQAGHPRRNQPHTEEDPPKIVDVLAVQAIEDSLTETVWAEFEAELEALLRLLADGQTTTAHGRLARRVSGTLRGIGHPPSPLGKIDVAFHDDIADEYVVLDIRSADTPGFLYEFATSLSLTGQEIAQAQITSTSGQARDLFYLRRASAESHVEGEQRRQLLASIVLVKNFAHLLPYSADPQRALLRFQEFSAQLFAQPNWAQDMISLDQPEVLTGLARLLGASDYLWEDVLRVQYGTLLPVLGDLQGLRRAKSRSQLSSELETGLSQHPTTADRRRALNAFKDREMFRIDMRHIQKYAHTFEQFSRELTALAEVVIEGALAEVAKEVAARYPGLTRPALTVMALGKCGGHELGYASDIELMFIYRPKPGDRANAEATDLAAAYCEEIVREFLGWIRAKQNGIFNIDLRLRPHGSAGSLAVSLRSFRQYFSTGGDAWPYERQALVKMRPIAGDADLAREVSAQRDAYVYSGEPFDVTAMRALRERQMRQLVTGGTLNAKFSPGGLVDIEYLAQGLQITHGHDHTSLRVSNTLAALGALITTGILGQEEHSDLDAAYRFIREVIDGLRMVRGNARDLTVPSAGTDDLEFLAHRLDFQEGANALYERLTKHLARVAALNRELLDE